MASAKGETRNDAPPLTSSSACSRAWRSSVRVAPPKIAPMNRPSGFRARRIWIRAPTRSLVQCRDRVETARSRVSSPNGRRSSSATIRGRCRFPASAPTGRSRTARRSSRASLAARAREKAPFRLPRSTATGNSSQDRLQAHHDVLGRAALEEVGGWRSPGRRGRGGREGRGRRAGARRSCARNMAISNRHGKRPRAYWATVSRSRRSPAGPVLPPRAFDGGAALSGGLSAEAWSRITFLDDPVCDGCGAPFAYRQRRGRALRAVPGAAPGLRPSAGGLRL
jgi:hypothetical protein